MERMLLNAIEKALVNNPLRAAVQRHFEARRLLTMGGAVSGAGLALEMGCGRGVGTEIALDAFGAKRVDAFDLDPRMVELARKRLAPRGDRVRFWVGDAAHIDAPDATYDAVFDFAIIHHVPAWRDAVAEAHRVLKPGGRLYADEVLERFIHHPIARRLLEHPKHDRFGHDAFRDALEAAGLRVVSSNPMLGLFGWFVAERPALA